MPDASEAPLKRGFDSSMSRQSSTREQTAALRLLAREHAVQTAYADSAGRRRNAGAEALMAALRGLGIPIHSPGDAAPLLEQAQLRRKEAGDESGVVIWGRNPRRFAVSAPRRLSDGRSTIACRIELEDGADSRVINTRAERRNRTDDTSTRITIELRDPLPYGVHRLTIEFEKCQVSRYVYCAPRRCFDGREHKGDPHPRDLGVFVPLYALQSEGSDGVADLGDLREFSCWAAKNSIAFVGALPLLASFLTGDVFEPSPYSPVSRLYWNELFLEFSAAPEITHAPEAQRLMNSPGWREESSRLRNESHVDYQAAMRLKRPALQALADAAFARNATRASIDEALTNDPHLDSYAKYRAAVERSNTTWSRWAPRMRDGELREGTDFNAADWRRHVYAQVETLRQLDSLRAFGQREDNQSASSLYLDLPLGVNAGGYDVWRFRELFAHEVSVGAPPDALFSGGQNWGFPPIIPTESQRTGHSYFRAVIRNHLAHASMLRIDHVMGLHRLYWIPNGVAATDGVYVRYPADEFYAILCIESHRRRARIVGENLGTVPAIVNKSMSKRGLLGMSVAQFQFEPKHAKAIPSPGRGALASVNTHDTPTFAAFWLMLDIDLRLTLGHLSEDRADSERAGREQLKQAIVTFLIKRGEIARGRENDVTTVIRAIHQRLAASDADSLLLNLEDLWGETDPQNVPGTTDEYPNWRRKTRQTLESIIRDDEFAKHLRCLAERRAMVNRTTNRRMNGDSNQQTTCDSTATIDHAL